MFGKVCFLLAVAYCSARSVDVSQNEVREPKGLGDSKISFLSDLSHVYRVYEECNAKDLVSCLKMKFVTALDRLSRKIELPITDQISLVKDDKSDNNNEMDNEVLEATLPRSLEEKDNKLDQIIAEKLVNFFATRSFQFKLSGIKDMQRSLQEGKGYSLYRKVFIPFSFKSLLDNVSNSLRCGSLLSTKKIIILNNIFRIKRNTWPILLFEYFDSLF